jgi:hypothetical protein
MNNNNNNNNNAYISAGLETCSRSEKVGLMGSGWNFL